MRAPPLDLSLILAVVISFHTKVCLCNLYKQERVYTTTDCSTNQRDSISDVDLSAYRGEHWLLVQRQTASFIHGNQYRPSVNQGWWVGKQSKLFKDRGWGNVFKFHRKYMLNIKLGIQNSFCLLNPFPSERIFLIYRSRPLLITIRTRTE